MKAHYAQGLELHHVQINAETGPAFLVQDARELELDGVSTRRPLAGSPVIRLDRCPGAVVRSSRAFPGTDIFLSVGPGELKDLVLEGDLYADARKGTEGTPRSEPINEPPTED